MRGVDLADRPHSTYRFYAADGALLYVGMTADLPARLRQHASDKPWWNLVERIESEMHPTRKAAAAAEALAIITEQPQFNSAGTGVDMDDLISAVKVRIREQRKQRALALLAWAMSRNGAMSIVYWFFVSCVIFVLSGMMFSQASQHGEGPVQAACVAVCVGSAYFVSALVPVSLWSLTLATLACVPPIGLFALSDVGGGAVAVVTLGVGLPALLALGCNPLWIRVGTLAEGRTDAVEEAAQ